MTQTESTSLNSTDKGARFRAEVARYLTAAGHLCTEEVRFDHIVVDIFCEWTDPLWGHRRIAIEAKWRAGTLRKDTVDRFFRDYQPLLGREVDEVWLVSNRDIAPDTRRLIARNGCRCITIEDLKRRVIDLEPYLRKVVPKLTALLSDTAYVDLRTTDGDDLLTRVKSWIYGDANRPMLILGGYGMGKTTFARRLTRDLAEQALADKHSRIPILISLGEVHDEQHITGLIARAFAEQYKVFGYGFDVFETLNEDGAWVVIFDGLDEMADAMTTGRFDKNLRRLLALNKGRARVLLLTRQTVFHTAAEYERHVLGREITPAGNALMLPDRRAFVTAEVASFTDEEAIQIVTSRLPTLARQRGDFSSRPKNWLRRRLALVSAPALKELRERPVHIEMLAGLAADPNMRLSRLSRHRLYDLFIHQLLEREATREGRFADFQIDIRRRFNTALAWWVWRRDQGMALRLAEIPAEVCREPVQQIAHGYGDEELKRELIAGCLIDNEAGGAHFRHRSIQEFLVSEHFTEALRNTASLTKQRDLFSDFIRTVKPAVADFVFGRIKDQAWPDALINRLFETVFRHRGDEIPTIALDLLVRTALGRSRFTHKDREPWPGIEPLRGPWEFILSHLMSIQQAVFALDPSRLQADLALFLRARESGEAVWDAAVMVWALGLRAETPANDPHLHIFLAEVYCRTLLLDPSDQMSASAVGVHFACMSVEQSPGPPCLAVNLDLVARWLQHRLAVKPEAHRASGPSRTVVRIPLTELDRVLRAQGWSQGDVDRVLNQLSGWEYISYRGSRPEHLQS